MSQRTAGKSTAHAAGKARALFLSRQLNAERLLLLLHRAVAVPAVNRSILSWLEGDSGLDSTIGTDGVEAFPLWAPASASSAATATATAALSGFTFDATIPAAFGVTCEAPLRIALLVFARMDELRSTVLTDDHLVFVSHLSSITSRPAP